jgi:branched-chain amino acid transport system substrate-binding protein
MKRYRTTAVFWMFFLAMVTCLTFMGTGYTAELPSIKIGMIASLTGPMAPPFKDLADAAKPTADLINARGGVTVEGKKYHIEIVTEDDQSSPPGAVAAMNRLIQQGVRFLLPPLFIPSNLVVTPLAEKAKILSVKSMGATKDQVNPGLRYSFASYTFVYNAPVGYDFLRQKYPKAKKVAILCPDDPVAKIYKELSKKEIADRHLNLVFEEQFKIGSEDFYPLLTRALSKKPDVIDVVFCIEPWSAGIINQSRELGFTGPIYASVGMLGDINVLMAMIQPKYAHDLFQMGANVQSANMPSIVKEYRELLGRQLKTPFNTSHLAVLDAVYVLVQGIQKAQSLDTDKIAQTLENMKSVDTVYGQGRMAGEDYFGAKHIVRRPIAINGVADGKIFSQFSAKD